MFKNFKLFIVQIRNGIIIIQKKILQKNFAPTTAASQLEIKVYDSGNEIIDEEVKKVLIQNGHFLILKLIIHVWDLLKGGFFSLIKILVLVV